MSAFDPDTFMDGDVEGEMDTVIVPVPVGDYQAIIDKVEARQIEGKDGKPDRVVCDVIWEVHDNAVKELLGRDKVTVKQSLWLDTLDSGALDLGPGKNVGLGKVRAALGQNKPGEKWSLRMLNGAGPAMIKVGHRPDKNDPSVTYAEVKSVGMVS